MAELRRATELAPDDSRYAFVYAVALHSTGQREDAESVLQDNLRKHSSNRDTLSALISFARGRGDLKAALQYAERLLVLSPADASLIGLIHELKAQVDKTP